ncbi:MAG TPA: LamG-like jellyroll fold domain-containing protein, partial [Candidatus Eisenbacteria bacterium]
TFQAGSGQLTIQTPTNRNLAPPGYYMLFILDTNGIPSVAATVRFPAPTEDFAAPSAPANLAAAGSVGEATLTWTASTDNIGVTAYDIYRSASAGFTPSAANKIGVTASANYVDAGLPAGTYFYKVQARDAAGNTSAPSNEANAAVSADLEAPTIPQGLGATAMSSSRIDLLWSGSTDNVRVAGYRVYRDSVEIASTTLPVYSDANLNESTTYTYTVAAIDDAGNLSARSAPASATTPASSSPSNFLVAAYSLDEGSGTTTADISNGGNNGTLTNSPGWVAGKYGNALSFNATDDGNDSNDPKVVLGRNLNIPNLPFTFSAWINPASFGDWRAIISKRDASSSSSMRFDLGLAASSGRVYMSTGSMFRSFLYSPPLNAWTHLTLVAEASGTTLYVNGVVREILGPITLGSGVNANVAIGGTGEGTGGDNDPYKGLLDELRLYNRALTQSEIATIMNTPLGNPGPQPPSLTITQPVNGATIGGTTVNVSYTTAGDLSEVSHVHFTLDGNMVMDLTMDGAYQFNNVAAGAHVLGGYLVRADHSKITGTDATAVNFTTAVPDTVPPTVSITSPAASSTLSGTVTVTANAGDNIGVVGVQFRVGAVNLTPEATTAPYSVPFNTASFPNGTYVLTAVARDAAGNQTTSAGVSVTVSNASRLIALYNFEEGSGTTTADLSGNGFNGTFTNGPAWVAGKYGNGLSFNASDDGNDSNDPKVVLGRTINIPNAPFTFSAWVNPASFADWRAIISKRDSPSASRMRVDIGLSASSGRV